MAASTANCRIHSGREAAGAIGRCHYCADCLAKIAAVARGLPPSASPRACFAVPAATGEWRAPPGTGAAHWVAHELNAPNRPGAELCAAGFPLRRADLLFGRRELERALPAPRDLWLDLDAEGCGVVVSARALDAGGVEISIRGLVESKPAVSLLDFYRDLHGRGRFFR